MADKTGISWTDATWNPIVGCSVVSPGCTNCYAMRQAARIVSMQPKSHYKGTLARVNGNAVWTGTVNQAPDATWEAPLRWKKPRRIFVNSMGDLFHESVPDEWIDRAFAVMALSPQHTFQVLTKRARRMREYVTTKIRNLSIDDAADELKPGRPVTDIFRWPLPNVWLGVSAEDQARADERIPDLLATPAAVRFVSAEPLLGPIVLKWSRMHPDHARYYVHDWLSGKTQYGQDDGSIIHGSEPMLDWIIAGGESGPGHRGMNLAAAYSIQAQCKEARTAFWFKQDSGPRAGMQGRASASLWAAKEFPQ